MRMLGITRPHREVWVFVQQKSYELIDSLFWINSVCSGTIGFRLGSRKQELSHICEDPSIESLQSARPARLFERDNGNQFREKLSRELLVLNFIEAPKENSPRECVLVSGIFPRRSSLDMIRPFALFGEFNGRFRMQSFRHCSDLGAFQCLIAAPLLFHLSHGVV